MKKCTGENCPMQIGYDVEKCAAIEKCPYRTWPITVADRIRRMNDLKPCPFCGGEAVISVDPDAVEDTQGRRWAYNAVCIRCCATSGLTYTPKKAKEVWNRRADNG